MLGRILRMTQSGVLGLNRRNGDYIMKFNNRRFYPLVDDKVICKGRLQEQGLAVPRLISVASSMRQASRIDELLQDNREFVIKPAHGSGGNGILVIRDRKADYFVDSDGNMVQHADLEHHNHQCDRRPVFPWRPARHCDDRVPCSF